MWGSDYPHHDATFPGAVDTLRRTLAPLAPEVRARILGRQRRRALPAAALVDDGRRPGADGGDGLTPCWATIVREAAARYGDTPLYVTPDGGALSYAELDRLLRRRGRAAWRPAACGAGDVVGLLLPSGAAYAVAYVAAAKIGAVTAGVNDQLSPPERRRCLEVARPRLVLARRSWPRDTDVGDVADGRRGASRSTPTARARATRSADAADVGAPATPSRRSAPDPDRPVAVVFTSGTTGEPKGAVFAERQLDAIGEVDGGGRWGGGGPRPVVDLVRPPRLHDQAAPGPARRGDELPHGAVVGGRRPRDGRAPPHHHAGGHPHPGGAHARATSASTTTDTSQRAHDRHGRRPGHRRAGARGPARVSACPVVVRYTCTEAGVGVGTVARRPSRGRRGVAWAGPGPASSSPSATTTTDRSRPARSARSACARRRSWPATSATPRPPRPPSPPTAPCAPATSAIVDERGRLHLSGRSKEMYVRGGYNVFPLEVENVLADHPGVAHVAVVPRPDPVMGEIGVAVVVARGRRRGAHRSSPCATHARARLAAYKLPEAIVVIDELPRTAMEKIDRGALGTMVRDPGPAPS